MLRYIAAFVLISVGLFGDVGPIAALLGLDDPAIGLVRSVWPDQGAWRVIVDAERRPFNPQG